MPLHRCLGCRGLANAGLLPRWQKWRWQVAPVRKEVDYHLVRLVSMRGAIVGGGDVWDAETACGTAFREEVQTGEGE